MAQIEVVGALRCMREHVRTEHMEPQGWEHRICPEVAPGTVVLRWNPDPFSCPDGVEPPRAAVQAVAEGWGLVLEGIALCPDCLLDAIACGAA